MMTDSPSISLPRVALVTGAGRRLGRAIALGLAQAGWDLALHYRHSESDAIATRDAILALGRRAALLQRPGRRGGGTPAGRPGQRGAGADLLHRQQRFVV
jgi:NAD(P)-dependent dehydrogenase (short-subunit alcohol dehydrogenase family)